MKSERELFERCFNHLDLEYVDGCGYCESETQSAWEAWQASANRQGYKLVPVEPTHGALKAGHETLIGAYRMGLGNDECIKHVYKAMTGAVDEH